jgi:aspartyl-tRNA(Asn)/glutamyl-tRNA(Gln) amidotransferase subunit A
VTNDNILFASIPEVGRLYRSGELSPVEVTQLTLERIEALNPTLNAFITVTSDVAMQAASRAEHELRAGTDRGPLHGIPVALKDLVDTAGIRTTAGSRILADHVPGQDAPIVTRLKDAGAVIIGKTNMLEFAYGIVHPDYGATWNPWDPQRTAGGSSGGSAAAVAAGLCYAAAGTDTGGSIRIPAAYCGVAGFKPTYGLVSLEGIFPLSWSLDHLGPMARTSEDAAILLATLADVSPSDFGPTAISNVIGRSASDEAISALEGVRFGLLAQHLQGAELEPAVRDAFDDAISRLQDAGAQIQDVKIPDLEFADETLLTVITPEASAIHARWIAERPADYAPMTRQQIELGFAVPAVTYVRAQQYRRHLTAQFMRAFQQVDAILSPTSPWVAPQEDPSVVGDEGSAEARRTAPYNLTGLPAHTVPCGFSSEGLPVALQIATRPGADALALGIGRAFERLSGLQPLRPPEPAARD